MLSSQKAKTVVMSELTVPWEDHIEEANERKRLKYDKLGELCTSKGWAARCLPVEVGVRGFPAQSVHYLLSVFGVKGQLLRISVKQQRGYLTGFGLRVVR